MAIHLQVQCTTESRGEAEAIACALVEGRLAACAQIAGPIDSVYRWKGAVEQAREWLLLVKTTAERYGAVEATIVQMHSYEQPEVIATEIATGSAGYLAWISDSVAGI